MTAEAVPAIHGTSVPKLARGVRLQRDEVRGRVVLLAPERTLALDDIAIRIVEALDGSRTLDQIVDGFAEMFAAPRDQIEVDVRAFLQELTDRRLLEPLQ